MSETDKIKWIVEKLANGIGYDMGCGEGKLPGSIGIDIRPEKKPDVVLDCSRADLWEQLVNLKYPTSLDYIFSSHLIEDFVEVDQVAICKTWLVGIKPGGLLILYVPEKDAYKGTNFDHKREFEHGFMEKLFEDIGIKQFIVSYESNWSSKLYGILGIGRKGE